MPKNNVSPSRRGLSRLLAVAAFAVVGAVGLHAVATDSEAGQLLASELPSGTSLSTASNAQVVVATRRAVRKSPKLAVRVVRAAILSKTTPRRTPRRTPGRPRVGDDLVDLDQEYLCPPCDFVVDVTRSGLLEDSDEASKIIEEAIRLCPACAGDLQNLANDPGLGIGFGNNAFYDPAGPFGFGLGLGPGFPGSPGFLGSPPSGILSLPPTGPAVTSNVNQ